MMKEITGGVCAATGFTASGLRCGVKAKARPDRKALARITVVKFSSRVSPW